MVGVPGRSKGCITCKQRKVKCDEAKPVCNRCKKAYMICEGYASPKSRIFVNEANRFPQSRARQEPCEIIINLSDPRSVTPPCETPPPNSTSSNISPKLWQSLDLGAFELEICLMYTTSQIFPGKGCGPQQPHSLLYLPSTTSWIFDAIDNDPTTTVLSAAYCLSTTIFARRHDYPEMLRKGAVYYSQALTQLGKNLKDPEHCWDASNVAAAMLLLLYELSNYNNKSGWMQHANGMQRLLLARGPEAHRQDPARHYFLMARLAIIARAIDLRKRTFLEKQEWKVITSSDGDVALREPLQDIMNLTADIPGILEDSDLLAAAGAEEWSEDNSNRDVEMFRDRIVQALACHFRWRWEWEQLCPEGAWEVPVNLDSSISVDGGRKVFDTVIFYGEFHRHARAILMYDTGLLILMNLARRWEIHDAVRRALDLVSAEMDPPIRRNPLIMPHEDLSIDEVSEEICRSVEYKLQGPHFSAGAIMLLLPLKVMANSPSLFVPRSWLIKVMMTLVRACGFSYSERLASFGLQKKKDNASSYCDSFGNSDFSTGNRWNESSNRQPCYDMQATCSPSFNY